MCDPINGDISLEDEKRRIFIEKDIKYTCEDCKKGFSTKQGLERHINSHCKKETYIPKIKKVKEHVKEQNFKITLNNFGSETVNYIDNPFIKDTISKGYDGIIELVKYIYMNPLHPENKTYIIKSIHSDSGLKYVNNEWVKVPIYSLLESMVNYTIIVLKTRILKLDIEESEKASHFIYFNNIGKHTLSRIRKATLFHIISCKNKPAIRLNVDTSFETLSEPSPCLYVIPDPPQLPSVSNH